MKNLINQLKPEGYYQLKPDLFSTKTVINFSGYEAGNEVLVEFHRTRNHHLYTYRYIKSMEICEYGKTKILKWKYRFLVSLLRQKDADIIGCNEIIPGQSLKKAYAGSVSYV